MRQIILLIIILTSCGQDQTERTPKQTVALPKPEKTVVKKDNKPKWISSFPEKIRSIESSFLKYDIGQYECGEIKQFYSFSSNNPDVETLTQLNDSLTSIIFGEAASEYGTFHKSFLYSIEKPITGFFPITVIPYFGEVDRPLLLVLFDSAGNYHNSIEVANYYGQVGGCLSSLLINDSLIQRNFKWSEISADSDYYEYRTDTINLRAITKR